MGRKHLLVVSAGMTVLLMHGCKQSPPAPPPPPPPYVSTVQLTIVDTSMTEVWLNLKFTDASYPRAFALRRDTQTVLFGTLLAQDTVLLDTGRAPRTSYTYKAFRLDGATRTDSSTPLRVTTMDTTSHNFTFEIDTLGVNASTLFDIAIVNDTLVYAVGEMLLRDSIGQVDPILYNLALWNGHAWNIQRVPYYYHGIPTLSEINWIFALNQNDIWLGNSTHWNGQQFENVNIGGSIFVGIGPNNMWGGSSGELCVVGNSGTIAYSPDHGITWERIESGTNAAIQDIWGNGQEILAVASNVLAFPRQKNVLRIEGASAIMMSDAGLPYDLSGIWFVSGRRYYVVGDGIFWKKNLSEPVWNGGPQIITTSYINAVRGTAVNDVFAAGAYGEFLHFNGSTWRSFRAETGLSNGQYYSIAIRGNLVFAVGYDSPHGAVVLRGRRQ